MLCVNLQPQAAVQCEIRARTHTHTHCHWGLTTAGKLADDLMVPDPLRIEVTETLIRDSLQIASVYFYTHLLKYYICSCFKLHFLYPSLCFKETQESIPTEAKQSIGLKRPVK